MNKTDCKPMLLLKINVSIGDKRKHLSLDELINLFDKKETAFSKLEKYAINIIQTEASKDIIHNFVKKFDIDGKKLDYILNCRTYDLKE